MVPTRSRRSLPRSASSYRSTPTSRTTTSRSSGCGLDAYRRIAGATSPADVDAVRDELVDRYGPLGEQVENLLAVASFRQLCRSVGVTEVAMGPQGLRMAPIHLPESGQMRLARMYPGSKYRELTSTLTLRPPTEAGRTGGDALRDRDLLGYCSRVLEDLVPVVALVGR